MPLDNSPKQKNLKMLFAPDSIAVIGVSKDKTKLGYKIFRNILLAGYSKNVYAVNNHGGHVDGYEMYESILDISGRVDTAVVAVPAQIVPQILIEAGKKGVANVVIITAGFKENGRDGADLERQIAFLSKKYSFNILGPNCLGFISTKRNLNISFAKEMPTTGNVVLISQSGAFGTAALDWAKKNRLGFYDFLSIGNKTIINENDLLIYYLTLLRKYKKPPIKVIGMYLEDFSNGIEFIKYAKQLSKLVPLVILKPGHSNEAKEAMSLHTGALAGDSKITETALEQANVIQTEDISEFFNMLRIFSWCEIPKGPNIAVITNAGGPAIVTTDLLVKNGLNLARFTGKTKEILNKSLPRTSNVHDPLDVIGDALADRYKNAVNAVLAERKVDGLLVLLTPQIVTQVEETASVILQISRKYKKPVIPVFIGGTEVTKGIDILNVHRIPAVHFPRYAVEGMAALNKYRLIKRSRSKGPEVTQLVGANSVTRVNEILNLAKIDERKALAPDEVEEIARLYKIPIVESLITAKFTDLKNFSRRYGFPVVVKIASYSIMHKTELGGVVKDIHTSRQLKDAYKSMRSIIGIDMAMHFDKVGFIQIQKQIVSGYELIFGIKRDPNFGTVLVFGSGGIYTELMKDISMKVLPIKESELIKMIESTNAGRIIKGYRNQKGYNMKNILHLSNSLSTLAQNHPQIKSIDINPCIINSDGTFVVDMKITL